MSPGQTAGKTSADGRAKVVLRLYIVAGAPNSVLAVNNIKSICHEFCRGSYRLDIVDVLEHPGRAMNAGILVTPTLVKLSPEPVAQVVGNLSDRQKVLIAIGLPGGNHE